MGLETCSRAAMSSSDVAWKPRSLNICAAVDNTALRLASRCCSRTGPAARAMAVPAHAGGARRGLGAARGWKVGPWGCLLVGVPGKSLMPPGRTLQNLLQVTSLRKSSPTRLQENPQRQTPQVLKLLPRSEMAGWARQTRAVISRGTKGFAHRPLICPATAHPFHFQEFFHDPP